MISQEYFDEMCLENAELFFDGDGDNDDCDAVNADAAVEATLEQLAMAATTNGSSNNNNNSNSTSHLLTSFPTSRCGIQQRACVAEFLEALRAIQKVIHDMGTGSLVEPNKEDTAAAACEDWNIRILQKLLELIHQRLFSIETTCHPVDDNDIDSAAAAAAAAADENAVDDDDLVVVVDRTVYMALFVSSMHDGFGLYLQLWCCLHHNESNNKGKKGSTTTTEEDATSEQVDDLLYWLLWSTLVRVLVDNDQKQQPSSRRQVLSMYQKTFTGTTTLAPVISVWLQTVDQKLRQLREQHELFLPIQQDLQNLFTLAFYSVKQCEANKKAFMSVHITTTTTTTTSSTPINLVRVVLESLDWILAKVQQDDTKGDNMLTKEERCLCMLRWTRDMGRLITALDTFDDFSTPANSNNGSSSSSAGVVSSGHDHVQAWKNARAIDKLHALLVVILQQQRQHEVKDGDDHYDGDRQGFAATTTTTRAAAADAADAAAAAIVLALRSMAIQDDVVQAMVSLGILDTATQILLLASVSSSPNKCPSSLELLSAVMGLVRNLCANDEIKTNLCLGSAAASDGTSACTNKSSIVPGILHAMQRYSLQQLKKSNATTTTTATATTVATAATLQEHAIGTMAAMALRKPFNSDFIVRKCHAHVDILQAMRDYPQKTTLQRQGALCIRNLASRAWTMSTCSSNSINSNNQDNDEDDQDLRTILLQADAATVLRETAAKHLHCQDEVYAALRDLGVPNIHFTVVHLDPAAAATAAAAAASTPSTKNGGPNITTFGQGHNRNFRPVQDEST